MSDAPSPVAWSPPPSRIAALSGQPVVAWRNPSGQVLPVAGAPAADLAPIAAGPPMAVFHAEPRLIDARALEAGRRPGWWSAWLASVLRRPDLHVWAFLAVGLGSTLLLIGEGRL